MTDYLNAVKMNLSHFTPILNKVPALILCLFLTLALYVAADNEIELDELTESEQIEYILNTTASSSDNLQQQLQLIRKGLILCRETGDPDSELDLFLNASYVADKLNDYSLSSNFLDQAESVALKNGFKKRLAEIKIRKGDLREQRGEYKKALEYYLLAEELFEQQRNVNARIDVFHAIALLYSKLKDAEKAQHYAEEAQSSAIALNDLHYLGRSAEVSGTIPLIVNDLYSNVLSENVQLNHRFLERDKNDMPKDIPEVKESLERAIAYYKDSGDESGIADCNYLIGVHFQMIGRLQEAENYFERASGAHSKLGVGKSYAFLLINLASVYAKQELLTKAYSALDSAISILDKSVETPWVQFLKAQIALTEYNDDLAFSTLVSAIDIALLHNDLDQLKFLYGALSRVYLHLGEFDKSLSALEQSNTYSLRIAELEKKIELDELKKLFQESEETLKSNSDSKLNLVEGKLADYKSYVRIVVILIIILIISISIIISLNVRAGKYAKDKIEQLESNTLHLKEQVRRLSEERNNIFKSLAHELRTPMNGIIGAIPLLNDTQITSIQENYLNIIDISSRSILTLINDISDLSKLDSGDLRLANKSFDLIKTTETVSQIFHKDSTNTDVELVCEVPSDPIPILSGDSDRIQQILMTLLGRSFQTTFEGVVHLKIESLIPKIARELNIRITVDDMGEHVAQESLDHIFELAPNLTNINSLRRPASILGMSITKKLVEAMNGSIEVRAKEQGGLIVTVLLPFTLHPRLDHWQFPTPYERFDGKKVLFIDSNVAIQSVYQTHFKEWGLEVFCFDDTETALKNIQSDQQYDVIFLNTVTKQEELTALEKISVFRNNAKTEDTPIILLVAVGNGINRELKRQKYVHTTNRLIKIDDLHACLKQAILFKTPVTQSFASLTPEPKKVTEIDEEYPLDPKGDFHFIPYILPFNAKTKIDGDLKILLAEDNVVNQKVTKLMLKKMGYDIDVVSHGLEAVEAVKTGTYDVVLMDKLMPVMDGLEATLNIRKLENIKQPIIVALTASASMEDEVACRKATMDNFLAKPVKFEKMKAALAFATNTLKNRKQMENLKEELN